MSAQPNTPDKLRAGLMADALQTMATRWHNYFAPSRALGLLPMWLDACRSTDSAFWNATARTVRATWPEAPPSPPQFAAEVRKAMPKVATVYEPAGLSKELQATVSSQQAFAAAIQRAVGNSATAIQRVVELICRHEPNGSARCRSGDVSQGEIDRAVARYRAKEPALAITEAPEVPKQAWRSLEEQPRAPASWVEKYA